MADDQQAGAAPEAPLSMTFDEATMTLVVTGDIEVSDVPLLEQRLASRSAHQVTVDLSGTTYFPSRAAGALVLARRDARRVGGDVALVADPRSIAGRILRLMGLDR